MGFEKGRQQFLGVKREAVRLTAETSGFIFLPWNERAITNENSYSLVESSMGNRGAQSGKLLETQHAVVNIGDYLESDSITEALFAIFGSETKATANGATTRDFTFNQNIELPTFTAVASDGDIGQRSVNGCVANKFSVSTTMQESMYSLEAFGLKVSNTSGITPVYTVPNKYLQGRNVTISYASNKAGLSAGTAITSILSANFEIENGVDPEVHKYFGNLNPTNMTADGIKARFEFEVQVRGAHHATFQGWHDNGTAQAFKISYVASHLPSIGTSSIKPTFEIEIPASVVTIENTVNRDEIIKQKFIIEVNTPHLITAKLINAVA